MIQAFLSNVDVALFLLAALWLSVWAYMLGVLIRGIWQGEKQRRRERELSGRGRMRVGL